MRLGVVLKGTGVHGAACAGALMELMKRQEEPYAVCGLGSGAWPAALFACGCDAEQMELACAQAQRMGKRLIQKRRGSFEAPAQPMYDAVGMQRLLQAQTGGRLLALCPRKAMFPVRAQGSGIRVFASQGCMLQEGVLPVAQASAAFAVRAAMGFPPFLEPLDWMGAALLPLYDTGFAARMLFASGAQRVLIAEALPSPRAKRDALLLAAAGSEPLSGAAVPGAMRLTIRMPEQVGALSFAEITACMEMGRQTASRELDQVFETMGMAFCRVLPFRR